MMQDHDSPKLAQSIHASGEFWYVVPSLLSGREQRPARLAGLAACIMHMRHASLPSVRLVAA